MNGTGTRMADAGGTGEARRPDSVRAHNTALVLGLLRDGGRLSRAALARETGLSLPTVMDIVDRLAERGLVRVAGTGVPAGGRPPRLYEFTPGGRTAVGISVGTGTTTAIVTDLDATVLHEVREPSRLREGPDACVEQVTRLIDGVLEHVAGRHGAVIGIGLAVAAHLLDSEDRALRPWDNPAWPPLDLRSLVAERYGVTVELDNYAKAVAVGEHRFGAARGYRHVLCVVLQDGVGAALITNGTLYRGWDGAAGQFGATVVRTPAGATTLDSVAGSAGIVARAAAATPPGRPAPAGVPDVCADARQGGQAAVRVLREVGELLGEAVHNASVLLDPEVVVLTGPTVVAAGDHLVSPVARTMTSHGRRRVVTGALGERAGAIGAVALLLRTSFIDPVRAGTP